MKNIFLSDRFFWVLAGLVLLFAAGFAVKPLFPVAQVACGALVAGVVADWFLLFGKGVQVLAARRLPRLFSLGDINTVGILLENQSPRWFRVSVLDELPFQFQKRDFEISLSLNAGENQSLEYQLRPLERGSYAFGNLLIFLESKLGLLQRRLVCGSEKEVPVYPSIIQMKKYELRAFHRVTTREGIKQIRRIGHSYEFEEIKNYVHGDDYRSVNWKATGRRHELMVNQYQDERSQEVYCILDKSRVMKMPFDGLSLLDHAINTSLVMSNIALQKYDKVGLLTFSDRVGAIIPADRKKHQLHRILHVLYREQEHKLEANYELLYHAVRKLIPHRSLLLLFTNFESSHALDRVLPLLRRIGRFHLLVVVFFENTEIKDFALQESRTLEGIYVQAVAQNYVVEKQQMAQKLQQYGIQCILTRPEDLSINTINKYLELKARGMV
jgi:uncharacterized protein (DUF58 family)